MLPHRLVSLGSLSQMKRVARFATKASAPPGPLKGIRVLDLTRILAGPHCTQLLGDMGAEIIKVENPRGGDDTRDWGPPFKNGESAYFLSVNRNKKSVTVNFKEPEGLELIKKLAAESDVFIENFLPTKLASIGLGYEDLSKINPRLVYVTLTGYGSDGPDSHKPGFDVIAAAHGGLMSITGERDGPPVKVGVAMTDICTGLYAHGAIIAALYERMSSGLGQRIDCSLLETQVACLANIGSNYLIGGKEGRRWGTQHESIVPYQAFETLDGWVVIGATTNQQFARLCDALGKQEWAEMEEYRTNADRVANRVGLIQSIQDIVRDKATAEWVSMLEKRSVTVGPINSIKQVFEDRQVLHREMVQVVNHKTAGPIKVVGSPVKYSRTKARIQCAPPVLGDHTESVLQEVLGMDPAEVSRLRGKGVV